MGLVYDPDLPAPPEAAGRIARYAGGEDYHEVLLDRLHAMAAALEAVLGRTFQHRAYVDTGPVLEKVWAAEAGLGWIGKNTCLIHPRLGSYLFLGVLCVDIEIPEDDSATDHCGSCRACLDSCPTDAFPEPYVLDASRCIAYTTIELRGEIPEHLREAHGNWLFGCDICQEVCPWNQRRARKLPEDHAGLRARLAPAQEWIHPSLSWILTLDEKAWRGATRKTALRRAKYHLLLRNALVVAGNQKDASLIPLVEAHCEHENGLIQSHARWALLRLKEASSYR